MTVLSRRAFGFSAAAFCAISAVPAVAQVSRSAIFARHDEEALPPGVKDMLSRIRNAARSGDIDKLRIPIERNELPPIFERGKGGKPPIPLLKARSADGEGKEMLQILLRVLDAGFATLTTQPSTSYIWPYYARRRWSALDRPIQAQSWSLVRIADIGVSTDAVAQGGAPLFHQAIISQDGTWQMFAVA